MTSSAGTWRRREQRETWLPTLLYHSEQLVYRDVCGLAVYRWLDSAIVCWRATTPRPAVIEVWQMPGHQCPAKSEHQYHTLIVRPHVFPSRAHAPSSSKHL